LVLLPYFPFLGKRKWSTMTLYHIPCNK